LNKVENKRAQLEAQNEALFKQLESDMVDFKKHLLANMPLFKEGVSAKLSHI